MLSRALNAASSLTAAGCTLALSPAVLPFAALSSAALPSANSSSAVSELPVREPIVFACNGGGAEGGGVPPRSSALTAMLMRVVAAACALVAGALVAALDFWKVAHGSQPGLPGTHAHSVPQVHSVQGQLCFAEVEAAGEADATSLVLACLPPSWRWVVMGTAVGTAVVVGAGVPNTMLCSEPDWSMRSCSSSPLHAKPVRPT
mmetsp:Transcript_78850/g.156761  ORF Transcript_78850/g.156761 Transcript_78850/m.156761 type:complete len:203 (+) Transcript_78850:381-989(+)